MMKYLRFGLIYYDKYIQRKLKCQFKDVESIFSFFATYKKQSPLYFDYNLKKDKSFTQIVNELSNEFKNEDDKLAPIKYLKHLLKIEKPEDFLINVKAGSRIINWNPIIAAFITSSVAIIIAIFIKR